MNNNTILKRLILSIVIFIIVLSLVAYDPVISSLVISFITILLYYTLHRLRKSCDRYACKIFDNIKIMAPNTAQFISEVYFKNFYFFIYTKPSQLYSVITAIFSGALITSLIICLVKIFSNQEWSYFITVTTIGLGYVFNTSLSQKFNFPLSWLNQFTPHFHKKPSLMADHIKLTYLIMILNAISSGQIKEPFFYRLSDTQDNKNQQNISNIYIVSTQLMNNYFDILNTIPEELFPEFLESEMCQWFDEAE